MTVDPDPAELLTESAALWSAELAPATDLVHVACAALAAGVDGPGLRMLAALSTHQDNLDYEVAELAEAALTEVGLTHHPRHSPAAEAAAISALARQCLRGHIPPRELTRTAHALFGHEDGPFLDLSELDDVYDSLDVTDLSVEEVDEQVREAARRVVGRC